MYSFIFLIMILFCSVFINAQNFSGTYTVSNHANGTNVTIILSQNSIHQISGKLILNNADNYDIEGKLDEDDEAEGTIRKGNEISFFEAYLENQQLYFTWIPSKGNIPDYNSAIDVVLKKTNEASNNIERRKAAMNEKNEVENKSPVKRDKYQQDPILIGLWRYSKSYTSGGFSMVSEKYMEIRADGTYSYGNGRVVGGGNSGSFDSGGGGDFLTGKWCTENRIIYIDENSSGDWIPYSGYYVEGNSLLLKFNNGSKEIWHRQ
ncbi:MAG: hypothetical protein P8Z35_09020 [Ignavibacteriaceae bacterium]